MNPQIRTIALGTLFGVVAGNEIRILTDSTVMGAVVTAVIFAMACVFGGGTGRDPALAHTGELDQDPADSTRSSAARTVLACLSAVLLSTAMATRFASLDTGAGALRTTGVHLGMTVGAFLMAYGVHLLIARAAGASASTLAVGAIVLMMLGQLISAGGITTTRHLVGLALVSAGWGMGTAGAIRLAPRVNLRVVAAVGSGAALVTGWTLDRGTFAMAVVLPIVLLAPAMISAIWAEVISLAGDRYFGEGKPGRR